MNGGANREDGPFMGDREIRESPWSLRKIVVLVSLCAVYLLDCGNITIIAPFFPTEAKERGVSDFATGVIFGSYSFTCFLFAPICGWLIPKYGGRLVLICGILICSASLFLFGFCEVLHDAVAFSALSLSLRIIMAVGAAASETATMAIALEEFSSNVGTAVGVLETFAGVGFAVGPAIGGFLYTTGGFRLPFYCFGSMMIVMIPVAFLTLRKTQDGENGNEEKEENSSMIQSLKIPGVLIISLCFINAEGVLAFVTPILAPHLKDMVGMNASQIGLFFVLQSLCYAFFSPVVGWIGDKMHCYRCMIVLGFVGAGLAYFILGPAPFLSFILPARKVWPVWVAMAMSGTFCSVVIVVLVPELKRIMSNHGMGDNASTNGIVSGIFSSMLNLGNTISPILAGVLHENIGFKWATAIEGFICFGQALLVVAFFAGEELAQRRKSNNILKGEKETLLEKDTRKREPTRSSS